MVLVKVFHEKQFQGDLKFLVLGGALALLPWYAIAALLGHTYTAAAISCILGPLLLFGALASRPGHGMKLLPGLTSTALSGAALAVLMPAHPVLAVGLFGAFFGLARATAFDTWEKKLNVIGSTTLFSLLGGVTFAALAPLLLALPIPAVLAQVGLFGLFGAYVALGSLPGHVRVRRDLVGLEYQRLSPGLRSEIKDHLFRAQALATRFKKALDPSMFKNEEEEDRFENNLDELILKIYALCSRWQELENYQTGFRMGDLEGRIKMIEEKARLIPDEVARTQYLKSKATLEKRYADFRELLRVKERLVSNLTYYFTTLEDMYYTTVKARCADASGTSQEVEKLFHSVSSLTDELAVAARSIEELALEAAAVGALPPAEPGPETPAEST